MMDKFLEWLDSEIETTNKALDSEIENHGRDGEESLANLYSSILARLRVVRQAYTNYLDEQREEGN